MKNNIPKELNNAAGIYEIRNLVNDKVYVGSTTNFSQRQRCHKSDLIRHRQTNGRLFNAYLKYGIDAFQFTILCELKQNNTESKADFVSRLLLKEYEYIDKLGANIRETGYNIRLDPETNFGAKLARKVKSESPPKPNQSIGSLNKKAVINEAIAKEIKLMFHLGYTSGTIAKTLQVGITIVGEIKRGKTWRHIILSDEDIESYQPCNLIRGRNSLNVLEVKKMRFLLLMGFPATPISLFFKAPYHVAKSIKLGKGYRTVVLTDEDVEVLKEGALVDNFKRFLADYKVEIAKNHVKRMQQSAFSKLTESNVLKIKEQLTLGIKPNVIAKQFPVTVDNIRCIARGVTWAHLTGIKSGNVEINTGKLSVVQRREILKLLNYGKKPSAIAKDYNVSIQAIYYLRNRSLV